MPTALMPEGRQRYFNNDGTPCAGGKLYTYAANTSNPKATYADEAGTVQNANPIVLDAHGEALIYWNGAYKVDLRQADGTQVTGYPVDNLKTDPANVWGAEGRIMGALAANDGAGKVMFLQRGVGAVARSLEDKERDILSVLDFMTAAEKADYRAGTLQLDHTAAYQKALNAAALLGAELWAPDGLAKITTALTVAADGIRLRMAHNAGIQHNTPDGTAIRFDGQRCAVDGGLGRGFIGPAVWDGGNVAPTYGVIQFRGNGSYARTRIYNVKKVGVWFKDVVDGSVEGSTIEGNYPSASWTQVETGHWGVLFDPSADQSGGNFRLVGNTIKSCVQGCQPGNYGSGPFATRGFIATGNIFEGCWNHGIYTNFTDGATISANSFNRCQIPVVISGNKNNVTSNTMHTATATAGDERDVVGISVRDGCGNVISNNTIKGVAIPAAAAIINIQDVSGLSELNDNVVQGNTIDITAGTCVAIRIVGSTNAINRNIIAGNTVKCLGKPDEGAIALYGKAGALNLGNKVHGNIITLSGESHGIYHSNLTAAEVCRNTVEYAWDSGAAKNLSTVAVLNSKKCLVEGNTSVVRPTFGANLSIFAYREYTAADSNIIRNNIDQVDRTKAVAYYPLQLLGGTNPLVDESGPGAPFYNCRTGSRWFRTDGGIGSTFYVRADPADPALWAAVA